MGRSSDGAGGLATVDWGVKEVIPMLTSMDLWCEHGQASYLPSCDPPPSP